MLHKTIVTLAVALTGIGTAQAQTAPAPTAAPTPPAPPTPSRAGGAADPQQQGELVVDVVGGVSAPLGIAIPVMPTSEAVATAGRSHRRARPATRPDRHQRSAQFRAVQAARCRCEAGRLCRGDCPHVRLLGSGGRFGAGAGVRARQWRRDADGRMLSVRRILARRTGAAGLRRRTGRLAQGGAQMRRHGLFEAHRGRPVFR